MAKDNLQQKNRFLWGSCNTEEPIRNQIVVMAPEHCVLNSHKAVFFLTPLYRGILERNRVIRWFHECCFYVGGKWSSEIQQR